MSGRDIGADPYPAMFEFPREQVRLFASVPLAATAEDLPFDLAWQPGGPWA